MKNLFEAGKLLFLDMASTLFFLVVYLLTGSIPLAVAVGVALGVAQIGWQLVRRKPIDTMEWMSLFLVVGSGTAPLVTNDPRLVISAWRPGRRSSRSSPSSASSACS